MKKFLDLLKNATEETLNMSLDNCHAEGLFSLVIGGTHNGNLTRAFIANKEIKPYDVQLHTHTYGLSLTVLSGSFLHHTVRVAPDNGNTDNYPIHLLQYKYTSPLNGGNGLVDDGWIDCSIQSNYLPPGAIVSYMGNLDIHTVSCSAGTVWIVEECGFKQRFSYVYGKKFNLDNLYLRPSQYQINDAVQLLTKALNSFIED